MKSRPYIANWAHIRDAERNFVNTQIKRKQNDANINCISPPDDSLQSTLHQTQQLEHEPGNYNEKKTDMIENMKMEMSSNPFMATWSQINDAEQRLVSTNTGQPTRGQVAHFKSTKNKVSLLIKSSLMHNDSILRYMWEYIKHIN